MIDLYTWATPNGFKPLLLIEETGLDFTIKPVDISKGDQFEPQFLKISPNNRIPAIVDHDSAGEAITLFESGAILQYLAEKTGKFLPSDPQGRANVLQWLNWQMGGLGPMLGQYFHFRGRGESGLDYSIGRYEGESERLLGVLDKQLADRQFVADEYSIADMAIYPWVRIVIDKFPGFSNIERWAETIASRPATLRAYEAGSRITELPTITQQKSSEAA